MKERRRSWYVREYYSVHVGINNDPPLQREKEHSLLQEALATLPVEIQPREM
jgi:hypothetical protein